MADSSNEVFGGLVFTANGYQAQVHMERLNEYAPAVSLLFSTDDGVTWNDFIVGETFVQLSANGHVWIKAGPGGNSTISNGSSNNYFVIDGVVSASGNINSLISADYETVTELPDYCFAYLFSNSSISSAPNLPADAVGDFAYIGMFLNCSYLRTPPVISAKRLSYGCFQEMFRGSSLEIPPALPAENLATSCYQEMFRECVNLTSTPDLPAKILPQSCYMYMFEDCHALTHLGSFSAESAGQGSCDSMFFRCESLADASSLTMPSITGIECFRSMFGSCTKLVTGPSLPATELSLSCYDSMFSDCPSLSRAPVLPARVLAERCYSYMFNGCSSLSYIETGMMSWGNSGDSTANWVYGVAPSGTFVCRERLPVEYGDNRIPMTHSAVPAGEATVQSGGWTVSKTRCASELGYEPGPCAKEDPNSDECRYIWSDEKCPDAGCGFKDETHFVINCGPCSEDARFKCGKVTGGNAEPCRYDCTDCDPGCGKTVGGQADPCYISCDTSACAGPCGETPTGGGSDPCVKDTSEADKKCRATGGSPTGSGGCECPAGKEWTGCADGCVCDPNQPHEDYCSCYYPSKSGLEYCTCMYLADSYIDYAEYCACTYGAGTKDYCYCRRVFEQEYDYCGCMHALDPDTYHTACKRNGSLTSECSCDCSTSVPCDNGAAFDSECGCDCSTASVGPDFCKNGAGWDTTNCKCDCSTASVHDGDCIYGFYSEGECACVCNEDGKLAACIESGGTWISEICRCDCGEGRSVDSEGHCKCDTDCSAGQHHVGYTCDCECDVPVGSECTVVDGDCSGYSGTVQSDCSCAVVCSGGLHPGDYCVSASALTSNGSKLNCNCDCEETCTPGAQCTASHGVPGHCSEDRVCVPDCTPGASCPDGIHVYDQSCNCVCENTGACTVDVGDCKDVPGHINEMTCACDPDCTPGSEECTYTDVDGNVGDGVKDCQCDCTCKKDGGSCAYDNKRPGKWTDDCVCTCNDVGSDCEFTDENGSRGSGSIGNDCDCHCVVGGGCVYTHEGRPINGKFSTDCVCTCNDVGSDCEFTDANGNRGSGSIGNDCDCHCVVGGDCVYTYKGMQINGTFSADCVCGCDDSGKLDCIRSGKGWDHLRCKCGCDDNERNDCIHTTYASWNEEDCTCRCDNETALRPKCEQEPSRGSWQGPPSCSCNCPEGKTLVDDECICGGSKEEEARNEEECKAGGGIEYDRMTCKCNCGEDKEWNATDKKCVCKNLAQEKEKCNKLGFLYNDKDCKCSNCNINETTMEVKLCQSSPDQVDFDFDECKCKCQEEHKVRGLTEEGVLICVCDYDYYKKEFSDCNTLPKIQAGWTWVADECECKCTDWENKTCLIGDYPKGKRNSKCDCECPPEAASDEGCGPGMFYNSECKCDCVINTKCTINPDIGDDGSMAKDKNGRCFCKCNGGGNPCSITDKHTGKEITGLTTGPDCYCSCGDKVGTPCEWTEGDPASGVLWDDCQCKCLQYHQFCTTDTIPYGQYDDNCECTCAPAGTKCLAADGTVGRVVNDGNGICACECDYEKEAKDCENKWMNDAVRKDGTPKLWEFSVNGCECKCADAGFDCWYENSEGELVPGQISADTCDCEDCKITAVTCIDPATPNLEDCNCECKGEEVPKCGYGKHNVYDMMPPCACACDNNVDEAYCSMQPHQGDSSDYLKLGEHCDCVCANANAECVMDSGKKGYKRESDCKCVCGLTAETAGCNDSQDFDPDQCKCVCKKDLADCIVGDRTWKPTEETKCLCACDDVHDCKNSGSWLDYDASGKGCKCDCSNAELPADHKWHESEYVKFADYDCTAYCTLTPNACIQPGSYDPEHCDCNKCLRIKEEGCKGATPDYYEDELGCGCWCDVSKRKKPTCNKFDQDSCTCKQDCPKYDQKEVDKRALCEFWDWDSCSFKPKTDSQWFITRDTIRSDMGKAITSLSKLIANLVVPSNTPDVTICPCAKYFYKPDGETITGDCHSPALEERVDALKSKYRELYKEVVKYHDMYVSCKEETEWRRARNRLKSCGETLETLDSCATDEAAKKDAMRLREELRSVQTSISNISRSLSGYCTGGNTCKECESGGGGGEGGGGDPDPAPTCSGGRYAVTKSCDKHAADSDDCYMCLLDKCLAVVEDEELTGYCACVYGSATTEYNACMASEGKYDRKYDDPNDYPGTNGADYQ